MSILDSKVEGEISLGIGLVDSFCFFHPPASDFFFDEFKVSKGAGAA